MDSSGSGGITANASGAKDHGNSDATTYANSHINVGGTTTFDIGNDVTFDSSVLNTNHLTGQVSGDLKVTSRQDTATYEGKQQNIGFNADFDLKGTNSSVSVNGGKTDISSDYVAVKEQAIIATQSSDLKVGGKGQFTGGALTTATPEDNHTVFKQGIETQDITNHSHYKGDSISAGISIGNTTGKPQANMNGIGYGSDGDSQTSTTFAGVTGMAGKSEVTTASKDSLNEPLKNSFDEQKVTEGLNAQVQITKAFDQERRKFKTEINEKEKKLRDKAKEQEALGNTAARDDYLAQANKVQQQGLLFDSITGALYGPNSNGATGYVAKAVSLYVANQIGQVFKGNDFENSKNGNNELAGVGSPQHLLAHAILGAAVSYATGNDALTGGLGASAGEGTALILSKYIYKVDNPSELTAEQKDTISSIASLAGLALGDSTGNVTDAVNAGETAKVAVENNNLKGVQVESLLQRIAIAERRLDGAALDSEMRNIRAIAAKMASDNFKEIQACEKNPTPSCLNKMKTDYGNVDFKKLKDKYRLYPGTVNILNGYEQRNNDVVTCSSSRPSDCVYINGGIRVMNGAVYELIGAGPKAGQWSKVPVNKTPSTSKANKVDRTPNGYEPDNDILSNKPSGKQEYDPNVAKIQKETSTKVAQSQRKHIKGDSQHKHGSYFNNSEDAQDVLDAFHSNKASVVGYNRQNQPIIKYQDGKGVYHTKNKNGDVFTSSTEYYLIKGTKKVSVVPYSPKGPKN